MTARTLAHAAFLFVLACGAPALAQAPAAAPPAALPRTIPLFPLPDVVVFPAMKQSLFVFEPRYREMVADVLKGDRVIGMVLLKPGFEKDYEGRPPVYPIGGAGTIVSAEESPDGTYTLELRGLTKFRILSEDHSRSYRVATVEPVSEPPLETMREELSAQRPRLAVLLDAIEPGAKPPREYSDSDLVNALSGWVDVDAPDRQNLLEQNGPLARSRVLIGIMEQLAKAASGAR